MERRQTRADHTESLHHYLRTLITYRCEGDYFGKPQLAGVGVQAGEWLKILFSPLP